jgi:hypothetical protein
MKIADIVYQLLAVFPRYTDFFSDNISITSLIRSGDTITATTGLAHNLIDGDRVYISGALTSISISSLTRIGNVAKGITASNHDLTTGYQTQVQISGADQTEYNGVHRFIKEDNRRTFYYEVLGSPATPATGSPKLIQNIKSGYNGWHIITVIDDTNFSFTTTAQIESPALGNITCKKNFRISGAISIERAIESYTKQPLGSFWAFVVKGSSIASKDRYTFNDSTKTIAPGQDFRSKIIEPFSVFVFAPTSESLSGVEQRDQMEDVAVALFKSILRLYLPSSFTDTTNYQIAFGNHGIYSYDYAYYIHEFTFENQYDLTYDDTVDTDDSVAFRDLRLQMGSYFDPTSGIVINTNVDLDNIPLT